LRSVGLVWDVKAPTLEALQKKSAAAAAQLQPLATATAAAGGDD
jgi:hypothetical protein